MLPLSRFAFYVSRDERRRKANCGTTWQRTIASVTRHSGAPRQRLPRLPSRECNSDEQFRSIAETASAVYVIHRQSAQLTSSQPSFRRQSIPCAVRLLSLGKNELDFPLREEESLYSLYFWEYDTFHEVVSDVAPRFRCGPHALEGDADILGGFRVRRRSGNELLSHLWIEVFHRVLTKKRKMLPNVSSIVDCRGIPIP